MEPGSQEFADAVKAATERDNEAYKNAKENGAAQGKGVVHTEVRGIETTMHKASIEGDKLKFELSPVAEDGTQTFTAIRGVQDLIAKAASPDAPLAEDGSPQSNLQHRFDLLDPKALYEMTHVLYNGARKYGENSWRTIPVADHLNHMIAHAYAYLDGNRDDKHLVNVMCRAMFALGVSLGE